MCIFLLINGLNGANNKKTTHVVMGGFNFLHQLSIT